MKNHYHQSFVKRSFDIFFSILFVLVGLPFFMVLSLVIITTSGRPVIFKQRRVGKKGKVFNIYKFRTMRIGAEKDRSKFLPLNQANGPVFKIANDPRFTKFGKDLARSGLDELPQLVNVLRGEMSLVGPRPLPVPEVQKMKGSDRIREQVKPGMTSTWVIKGSHKLKFNEWMRLDRQYVKSANILTDFEVIGRTLFLVLKYIRG